LACQTATENFNDWAPRNGFNKMTATKFGLKIKEYCDIVRPRTEGRKRCYKLKAEMLERFAADDSDTDDAAAKADVIYTVYFHFYLQRNQY
jgi:hypothetical protein